MLPVILCLLAFLLCFLAGRRSLVAGLLATLTVGYLYGIIRANVGGTAIHFLFDAAVAGLYVAQLAATLPQATRLKTKELRTWLGVLIGWPILLVFLPLQEPMVQFVGLRGQMFFVPFLLFGARLEKDDLNKLAMGVAVLNLMAFSFALAEFYFGIQEFFPRNAVTRIIYASKDVFGRTNWRIPSSFSSAHAYAGAMVLSVPLLAGAWVQQHRRPWKKMFLLIALFASMIGVFIAAARSPVIMLAVLLTATLFAPELKGVARGGWVLMIVAVLYTVSGQARLQRFMTLRDSEVVVQRVAFSANKSFWQLAISYPFGNGLGGGGTNMPFFLQGRIRHLVIMENEYARIMLEQGIIGLGAWVAFIAWAFGHQFTRRKNRVKQRRTYALAPAIYPPPFLAASAGPESRNYGAPAPPALSRELVPGTRGAEPLPVLYAPGRTGAVMASRNGAVGEGPSARVYPAPNSQSGSAKSPDPWALGRRLMWVGCLAHFATAFLGLGLLASVPSAMLLLTCTGWVCVNSRVSAGVASAVKRGAIRGKRILVHG